MKKVIIYFLLLFISVACQKDDSTSGDRACGSYKTGQSLYKGPQDGCYYINSNGNKTYVEREACKC